MSLNSGTLLFWIAISLCILSLSFKSDRKLSKHSFSSCKHLQNIEYFAMRSVQFKECECIFLSRIPYKIILFDNVIFSLVLLFALLSQSTSRPFSPGSHPPFPLHPQGGRVWGFTTVTKVIHSQTCFLFKTSIITLIISPF